MAEERNNNTDNTPVDGTQYVMSGNENGLLDDLMDEYISACIGIDEEGYPAFSYFAFGWQKYGEDEEEEDEDEDEEEDEQETDDSMKILVPIDIRLKDDLIIFDFDFSNEPEVLSELSEKIAVYESTLDIAKERIERVLRELELSSEISDDQRIEELALHLSEIDIPYMYPTIVPRRYHGNVCLFFDNEPQVISYTANKPLDVADHLVLVYSAQDLLIDYDDTAYNYYDEEEDDYEEERRRMEEAAKRRRMEEAAYLANNDIYKQQEREEERQKPRIRGIQ